MCTSCSLCSAFSVRKSTWVTAFVCHFPSKNFLHLAISVFHFIYIRLVRRRNWFLNCNSVKVRFVFNSLWIKFHFFFPFLSHFAETSNYLLPLQIIHIKMKWNWNQILWLVCASAWKAQHLVPSWKFDLVKINHSVELFSPSLSLF